MAIDFRVRPPYKSFRRTFHGRGDASPTDEALMDEFLKKLALGGIDRAVAMGRFVPGTASRPETIVTNDDVAALVRDYSPIFDGFGSVDVRNPASALAEIDHISELGLKGVAFDNPWSDPPLYDDDESLFPLYQRSQELGLIVSLTSSGLSGRMFPIQILSTFSG